MDSTLAYEAKSIGSNPIRLTKLTYVVMAAGETLTLEVKVRILLGLP